MTIGSVIPRQQTYDGQFRFFERINELLGLEGLRSLRIASAYARWDGLGLVSEKLEEFLQAGGNVELIFGFDNGVTSPDSFLYGLYLADLFAAGVFVGAVTDLYDNATFHPKMFQFWLKDRVIIVVGSANLTGAGISRNIETGAEFELKMKSQAARDWALAWSEIKKMSAEVDIDFVRRAKADNRLSSEASKEVSSKNNTGNYLDVGAQLAAKPLFSKFLEIKKTRKREAALRKLDPASERPGQLFLQILENETGGGNGRPGYQIQLPVATLSAFFGVGPSQSQDVLFRFPSDNVYVRLTHFENNTHRVRLRPLRDAKRPTIVRFERAGPNEYNCFIVPRSAYSQTLQSKCTQQTRAGARRWGIE
ncbi:phospholipase D family protein [Tropicimonas aquimaris]|uniref:Phospholipase D family protein n=1 Tax=Tropicimonas aquimaris TaxID=914152 RepID=A0ABW3IUC5_9RHOB